MTDKKPLPEQPLPPPPFEAVASQSSRPAPFETHFACVTLNEGDKLRFINFPPEHVTTCKNVINTAWPSGVQDVRPYGGSTEIKMHGYPWQTSSGKHDARRLMRRLLETLYDLGWVLQAGVDMSKKEYDKGRLSLAEARCQPLTR